ncbi:MAG: hypothetical protein ABEJ72_07635 [Candidatus Aenigmatarchaeota archaeon]
MFDRFSRNLDNSEWDGIDSHVEYFDIDETSTHYKNPLGEMDIVFYKWDEPTLKYIEVKTNRSHVQDGREQVERAQNFFEDMGYNFEAEIYVEDIERRCSKNKVKMRALQD